MNFNAAVNFNAIPVHISDEEVCSLYYQLVPGRLVGSKKSPEALSVAVSTNVGFFAKRFG